MVPEEPADELMGLEFQLRHQIVPSRAGRVRRGLRHGQHNLHKIELPCPVVGS
jgi:hypothetical protein